MSGRVPLTGTFGFHTTVVAVTLLGMSIAAIVGPGNIGTDLLAKLQRSSAIEVAYMVGVDRSPTGWRGRADAGSTASAGGVDWLLRQDPLPDIVFEATSAAAHIAQRRRATPRRASRPSTSPRRTSGRWSARRSTAPRTSTRRTST